MITFCIQCAMRAMVKGEQPPVFDETPEQHQARAHTDLAALNDERRELERVLAARHARGQRLDDPNDPL